MVGKLPVLRQAAEELVERLRAAQQQPLPGAQRLEAVHLPLEPKTLGPAVDSAQAAGAACS
jgi:hypothetical protein